ncbi:portal protein [Agrobacterium sp. rho-8.1]|nr:portal protein [Agrobacterium sp. rho-8.1]
MSNTTKLDNLAANIAKQVQNSISFANDTLSSQYDRNLRQYMRMPMAGDEKKKGRSKFVSSDVQERVDWAVAQILKVLDGQRSVAFFKPLTADKYDADIAKQQNAVVQHVLQERNSHNSILTPWVKNSCLFGLGVLYVDFTAKREESRPMMAKGVTDEALVKMVEDEKSGKIIIIEVGDETRQEIDMNALAAIAGQLGMPIDPNTFDMDQIPDVIRDQLNPLVRDIKYRKVSTHPEFNFKVLPVEDFIVSANADICPLSGGIISDIQGHRSFVSKEDLIERGYDKADVDALPSAQEKTDLVAINRIQAVGVGSGSKPSSDDVVIFEIFTRTKIDDDKSRPYRVTIGGDLTNNPIILGYEEVSRLYPYAPLVPFPIPNTLWGQGIADRVSAEQDLISNINRAVLDDLHMHVDPVKVINPSSTNMDDALNIFPGKVIRSEDPTGGISYAQRAFSGMSALPIIDRMKDSQDFLTGVGGKMVSLDASDFADVTATASKQRSNSQQILIEQVIRQMADTGYRYLIKVIIDLLQQNPEMAQEYIQRLTDTFTPAIDDWNPDMDVATTISFGAMDTDFRLGVLNQTLVAQQGAMQLGIAGPAQIYKTLVQIAEVSGLQGAESFYIDPATLPPAPPPPEPIDPNKALADAEVLKANLKAMADEKTREHDAYRLRVEDDFRRDELAQKLELERAKMEAENGAKLDLARLEYEMARDRQDVEWAMERERSAKDQEAQIEEQKKLDAQSRDQMLAELAQNNQQQMQPPVQPPMPQQQPPMPGM